MSFVKRGDVEILEILPDSVEDEEKVKQALKDAREESRNINKDGNNNSFNKESD